MQGVERSLLAVSLLIPLASLSAQVPAQFEPGARVRLWAPGEGIHNRSAHSRDTTERSSLSNQTRGRTRCGFL